MLVDDAARWHRLLRAALLLIAIVTGCNATPTPPDERPGRVRPSGSEPDGQADPAAPPAVRTSAAPTGWGSSSSRGRRRCGSTPARRAGAT